MSDHCAALAARATATALEVRAAPPEPPQPLSKPREPAARFPVEHLGVLADAANAIHERTQAPLAICGSSVLAAAGLAAQAHRDVELPTGEPKPLSLYLMTIAASGERKSSCDALALAPAVKHEDELRRAYDVDQQRYIDERDAYEAERRTVLADRKIKGSIAKAAAIRDLGAPPVAPLLPMVTAPEPTFEGVCRLLHLGQPSIGIFSAEGGQFIGGHAMNAENRLKSAAGLSSLWDTGSVKRLRAGDGALNLPGRRCAFHLMAQPGAAQLVLADPVLLDQGLVSRLLLTAPDSAAGTRLWRECCEQNTHHIDRYTDRILSIFQASPPLANAKTGKAISNELDPPPLCLAPDARRLWVAFADHVERQMAPGGELEHVRAFANKLPEQAARIAGVLAVADGLASETISEEQMARAIELAKHYGHEALRLARAGATDPDLQCAERLLSWLHGPWEHELVSLPDVYQRAPIDRIRNKATASRIVAILEDHRWLVREGGGAVVDGQRRRDAWRIIRPGTSA